MGWVYPFSSFLKNSTGRDFEIFSVCVWDQFELRVRFHFSEIFRRGECFWIGRALGDETIRTCSVMFLFYRIVGLYRREKTILEWSELRKEVNRDWIYRNRINRIFIYLCTNKAISFEISSDLLEKYRSFLSYQIIRTYIYIYWKYNSIRTMIDTFYRAYNLITLVANNTFTEQTK